MQREVGADARGELVIVIDCARLDRAADFWSTMLGYVRASEAAENDRYQGLIPVDGVGIEVLVQRVPESKVAKNRIHLDLRTANLEAEVQRALDAGANLVTDEPLDEDGWLWPVLTDPDANEFCVVQPPATLHEPTSPNRAKET